MIEFLKLRNENNPDLKFGLNYIILLRKHRHIIRFT